eukprot:1006142-Alexandrium_andersonii.AAC.1
MRSRRFSAIPATSRPPGWRSGALRSMARSGPTSVTSSRTSPGMARSRRSVSSCRMRLSAMSGCGSLSSASGTS